MQTKVVCGSCEGPGTDVVGDWAPVWHLSTLWGNGHLSGEVELSESVPGEVESPGSELGSES